MSCSEDPPLNYHQLIAYFVAAVLISLAVANLVSCSRINKFIEKEKRFDSIERIADE